MQGKLHCGKRSSTRMELFGRCVCGQRARLTHFDEKGRPHDEPYVRRLIVPHFSVYRVTCPACGAEYVLSDANVERSP